MYRNAGKAVLLTLAALILALAGCSGTPAETGTLQGTVTIGPIWPVEREGENPPVPCEVYEARKVMVYDSDGSDLVEQVDIDCEGHYRVELRAGTYTVDINRLGIDSSSQVPRRVGIRPGETVTLDIDIDTGIR